MGIVKETIYQIPVLLIEGCRSEKAAPLGRNSKQARRLGLEAQDKYKWAGIKHSVSQPLDVPNPKP